MNGKMIAEWIRSTSGISEPENTEPSTGGPQTSAPAPRATWPVGFLSLHRTKGAWGMLWRKGLLVAYGAHVVRHTDKDGNWPFFRKKFRISYRPLQSFWYFACSWLLSTEFSLLCSFSPRYLWNLGLGPLRD